MKSAIGYSARVLVMVCCIPLIPALATAQDDEVFGMYADTSATTTDLMGVDFEFAEMYLCLDNLTRSTGVSGWECNVVHSSTGTVGQESWTYEGGGVNAFDPFVDWWQFDVTVGIGPAALSPIGDVVHLATYRAFVDNPSSTISFEIRPLSDPSANFTDAVGYVDADNPGVGYACGNSTGAAPGDPFVNWLTTCATVNVGGTIETGPATWSGVKALFR